jgi:hypothetical protein
MTALNDFSMQRCIHEDVWARVRSLGEEAKSGRLSRRGELERKREDRAGVL